MTAKKTPMQQKVMQKDDPDFFRRFADLSYTWESWRNPSREFIYISPSCERIRGNPFFTQ